MLNNSGNRKPSKITKYIIAAAVAILFATIFAHYNLFGLGKTYPKPVAADTNREKSFHVNWAGKDYWIPEDFFHTPLRYVNDKDGANLQVLYPSFEPASQKDISDKNSWANYILISIRINGLDSINAEVNKILSGAMFSGNHKLTHRGIRYGLDWYAYSGKIAQDESNLNDLLVLNRDGNFSEYITCLDDRLQKARNEKLSSNCTYHFSRDGISYEILFSRSLIKDWRMMQNGTLKMMERFTSKQSAVGE